LALRRGGSGGWRYHDEGALVGATPRIPGAGDQGRLAVAGRARRREAPVGRYAAEYRAFGYRAT